MKIKNFIMAAAIVLVPAASGFAQSTSTYTPITSNDSDVAAVTKENNLKLNSAYQEWLAQYEHVGNEINDVAEQIDEETASKRGYPKKKTVQKKIGLVEEYIKLLQYQLDNPSVFPDLDKGKVSRKITEWQNHLVGLNTLVKKL